MNLESILLLINSGADINLVDRAGNTPLHLCIQTINSDINLKLVITECLMNHGALPTIQNLQGHDAVYFANEYFPQALPWLEHPENIAPIEEQEAGLMGLGVS